jgi:hypothetical protein
LYYLDAKMSFAKFGVANGSDFDPRRHPLRTLGALNLLGLMRGLLEIFIN